MKIRQLFLPRTVRMLFKKSRWAGVSMRARVLTWGLHLGLPRWVAKHVAARGGSGRVVVSKQGVMGIVTAQEYLRFTREEKARHRLREEFESWQLMRRSGFADLIARFMELRELPEGLVLAAEPLWPIGKEARHNYMLPVAQRFAAAANPLPHEALPPTIAAGLSLARMAMGGALPENFATESELAEAFRKPLLTGFSHQDLHWRNVLDRDGRPVLIDLKKCQPGRILAL